MKTVKQVIYGASVYSPHDGESIRIEVVVESDEYFYGVGEASGEEYKIEFSEVDLDKDVFYELVRIKTE